MTTAYKHSEIQSIELSLFAIQQLKEIRYWTLFVGVLGIGSILTGLSIFLLHPEYFWPELAVISSNAINLVMIVGIALLFVPGYYLIRFSIATGKALKTRESLALAEALSFQKKYYRSIVFLIIAGGILLLLPEVLALQPTR